MNPIVVAAIITAVAAVIAAVLNAKLDQINHAVNHKEPNEPTLREVAVETNETARGTAEIVVALAESLGEVKAELSLVKEIQEKHGAALTEHTAQDKASFEELKVLAHTPTTTPVHVEVHGS